MRTVFDIGAGTNIEIGILYGDKLETRNGVKNHFYLTYKNFTRRRK